MASTVQQIPETGFLRLRQIIGDRKKGIPPIIPVSRTSWYAGIKSGIYPPPIKLGGPKARTSVYRADEIRRLAKTGDWREPPDAT